MNALSKGAIQYGQVIQSKISYLRNLLVFEMVPAWLWLALLACWPLWWLLGVEQFIPLLLVGLAAVFEFWIRKGHIQWNWTLALAGAIVVWWTIPILWVSADDRLLLLRGSAVMLGQFCALLVVLHATRIEDYRRFFSFGISCLASYQAISGLVFICGIWRGGFLTGLGRLIPIGWIKASEFWKSVGVHYLGRMNTGNYLLPFRVNGLAMGYGESSFLAMLLIPFVALKNYLSKAASKLYWLLILSGLLAGLVFTEARTAFLGIGVALLFFISLALVPFSHSQKVRFWIYIGILLFVGISALVIMATHWQLLWEIFVIQWRGNSLDVRAKIYLATTDLLRNNWIIGYGTSMELPQMASKYSAGTHSSPLSVLFQHGIVGLVLYAGLWASIWLYVLKGWRSGANRLFWIGISCGLIAFHVRELTADWWWDLSVTSTVWTIWGLIILMSRSESSRRVGQNPS
jgi:hypothetical protein